MSDDIIAQMAKQWAEPFRETILEERDSDWRSAIQAFFDTEGLLSYMAKGVASGGWPEGQGGLTSWSDWFLGKIEFALAARAASVDTLPKGQDAKQGLAGTEGSAVGEAETHNPSQATQPTGEGSQ